MQLLQYVVFKHLYLFLCVPDARFYIGQQATQSADTTSATIRRDHVSTKPMQKATAAKTAPTVPLHTDHMTCAALSMISGAQKNGTCMNPNVLCICTLVIYRVSLHCESYREVQVMESQGGSGSSEGGGGDGQSGQAASTALIEKILSEEPRWQGQSYSALHCG